MSYSASEVKSGFFILLSIFALLIMTFIVGGMRGGEKQDWLIQFGYAGGLEKGAPVYFAGKEVGKVKELIIQEGEERPILVKVELPKNIIVRRDSKAYIDTLGMMGEKMVEISPGTKDGEPIVPRNVISGEDPIPMHEMIGQLNSLTEEMNPMVKILSELMQKNAETLQSTLDHLHGTTKGLDMVLNGNQEQIGKIIANLQETSANVRDMTTDLKKHPWRLVRKG